MFKKTYKITAILLVLLLIISLSAINVFAETKNAEQLFKYSEANGDNLEDGITVFPNGDIYVITESHYIKGFKQDGTSNGFTVGLPSNYCGNLSSSKDGTLFIHSTNSTAVYMYEPQQTTACKTLYSDSICQFLNVRGSYLYSLQGETKSDTNKRVALIKRVKISSLKALENGDTINWEKVYHPNYTAPSDSGNAYPVALAVDTANNAYIVDKGSSNGYDASVNGIYKYNLTTGKVTAMKFVDADALVGLTWLYSVNVDDFGNVAVLSRNSNMIAIFRPGSVEADYFIKTSGWAEDLASDSDGNLYFISYGNVNTGNSVFKYAIDNISVTGLTLSASSKTVAVGSSFTLKATIAPADATNKGVIYSTSNSKVATVSSSGVVKGVAVGTATITVKSAQGGLSKTCKVTVSKATNTLTASGKTVTVKYTKLKKKNQTILRSSAISVSNAKGTVTYKKSSGNSKITVASTGKFTVKKGLKKGTYKVKVKVTAAGNSQYKSLTKIVTVTIKVK
jgi:hypothetical protein